jgi:hypothetical protein
MTVELRSPLLRKDSRTLAHKGVAFASAREDLYFVGDNDGFFSVFT